MSNIRLSGMVKNTDWSDDKAQLRPDLLTAHRLFGKVAVPPACTGQVESATSSVEFLPKTTELQ